MSGPFRKLFVEVAQGILEAAAIEAEQRQRTVINAVIARSFVAEFCDATNDVLGSVLCDRYGWRSVVAFRDEGALVTVIVATLKCGHPRRTRFYDSWLARENGALAAFRIFDGIDHTRSCFCVPSGVA